eukprot:14277459-Alexandrium_andersonii.AAC.1
MRNKVAHDKPHVVVRVAHAREVALLVEAQHHAVDGLLLVLHTPGDAHHHAVDWPAYVVPHGRARVAPHRAR